MTTQEKNCIEEAKRVLKVEADALIDAASKIDESFAKSVNLIHSALAVGGKIVVSGVGKSGNVARKVSATLSSTGSMSVFLHPTEALHGDLGVLGAKDILLVFSHSGSSQELLLLLPAAKEMCAGVVAILGNPKGAISQFSKTVISAAVSAEACPHNLAPTASSTLAMALGDALALALKELAGFGPDHFAKLHPGGNLGKRLLTVVQDVMHKEGSIAQLSPNTKIDDVVIALTQYRHSGVCIVEGKTKSGKAKLVGVITEGDIRKALSKKEAFFSLKAEDIMTKKPLSVQPETKAREALELMEQRRDGQLSFLPVVDQEGGCVGILRIHDLVLAGLA